MNSSNKLNKPDTNSDSRAKLARDHASHSLSSVVAATRLRITEIFYSLQGETRTVGVPTIFIRLTGCPLRCVYCDTAYAFQGGQWWTIEEVLADIKQYPCAYITVTGGEPLAQKSSLVLLKVLCDVGFYVSLETSGALDVMAVDPRVIKVIDIKTPGSKEAGKNLWTNMNFLVPHDQIKFVICDEEDYEWAKSQVSAWDLLARCEVLFSPSYEQLDATTLANWIVNDRLGVRLQIQLHKYLWGDVAGR